MGVRFAENVKYLRELKKLNQADMLAACGFGRTTWNGYEKGTSVPSFKDLVRISDYFQILESDLIHTDIKNSDLNILQQRYKNRKNSDLNSDPTSDLKGKNKARELSKFATANEPEPTYTSEQAKDELIRTQKFTIDMLKEALAAAQQRLEETKKAKK